MKWSARIDRAIEIAAKQHGEQKRRNGVTPYIVHPFTVAWMVSEYTDNEETIIAALLHDVVEDTDGYGLKEISKEFGAGVAVMVGKMSKNVNVPNKAELPWMEVKKKHLEKLKKADREILLVRIMDHIHNAATMIEELKKEGKTFWERFNGTKEEKHQWELMNYEMFAERQLPEKLCHKFRKLIAEIYEG